MSDTNVIENQSLLKTSYLENELNVLDLEMKKIEKRTGKDIRIEKMLELAFQIVMLVMHLDARGRTLLLRTLDKEMKQCVENIKSTYVSKWGIGFTVASAVISFTGALTATGSMGRFVGDYAPRFFTSISPTLASFYGRISPALVSFYSQGNSQIVSNFAQAIGSVAQIPQSFNQRDQTGYQHEQGVLQRKQQEMGEGKTQKQQAAQQNHELVSRIHEAFSRAVNTVLSR